ncbi:hypothetical protein K491DRAFT_301446 [Lophiostoma macrostomum CBS 122681]|uniref:Uncharacterized protein n=1 Tax=Lophiostoma macrostomum CBS 122681 TaxID=1314788 RepID=A0A6A6TH85_9PLEO|nr:hypothetical protein K491DRAFT_301446 [Lophiostoma macrostomum CBS 122681]
MAAGLVARHHHARRSLAQPSFPSLAPGPSPLRCPVARPSLPTKVRRPISPHLNLSRAHSRPTSPINTLTPFPSHHHRNHRTPSCRPARGRTRRRSSRLSRPTRRTAKRNMKSPPEDDEEEEEIQDDASEDEAANGDAKKKAPGAEKDRKVKTTKADDAVPVVADDDDDDDE